MGPRIPLRLGTANIARLVLSLIIAFAIWAFVTNERDPDSTETYDDLDIQGAETLSREFQIVDSFPTVDVVVKGPQSVVQTMTAVSITPSVDLSEISQAGSYNLEVQVDAPSGLRDVEVTPETITIEVGTVVSRTMDITIVEPANPPATLTSISLSSTEVRLVGVEQNVDSVVRVEVPVVLSGRTESFTVAEQPVPYSATGESLADTVRVEPQTVQVSVEFEVRALPVPIIVQCACPNDSGGLEIRDLMTAIAIPSTVRIQGPEALLNEVSSVRTIPINIESLEVSGFLPDGAELDDSNLPEGVTLERQSVDVWVEIEQSIQAFSQQLIEPINVAQDVEVVIEPETVTYDIQGPAETLATLEGAPPQVIVDVDGLEPGTHTVSPRVVLPPDVRVVGLQPEEVQVRIEEVRPPTPTPTPTPTPEPTSEPSTSLPMGNPLSGDPGVDTTR